MSNPHVPPRPLAHVELGAGRRWPESAGLLRAMAAAGHRVDALVVDTLELIVDDHNLTRDIAADRLLPLLRSLLEAIDHIAHTAADKVIVAFPEEPWELVVAHPQPACAAVSVIGVGPGAPVLARDRLVSLRQLAEVTAALTHRLLDELVSLVPDVEPDEDLQRLRAMADRVTALELGSPGQPSRAPGPAPAWIAREATAAALHLRLELDAADPALLAYRGSPRFDAHALLAAGRLTLTRDTSTVVLHDGDGVLFEVYGWLERLERALRGARPRSAPTVPLDLATDQDALAEAFVQLTDAVARVLIERNPLQGVNQRYLEILDAARVLDARRRDRARGDRLATSPPGRAVTPHHDAEIDSDPVTFPHPVTATTLRRLRYRPRWTVRAGALLDELLVVSQDTLVVPGAEGVVAVSRDDGEVRWRYEVGEAPWLRHAGDGVLIADEVALAWVGLRDGRLRWRADWPGPVAPWPTQPVVLRRQGHAGIAVLAGMSGRLLAVDLTDGTVAWQTRSQDLGEWSAVVSTGPTVCLSTEQGAVEAVDIHTGGRPWRLVNRSVSVALRVLDAPCVLAVWEDDAGSAWLCVELLDATTGQGRWSIQVPDAVELVALELAATICVMVVEDEARQLWWVGVSLTDGHLVWRNSGPFDAGTRGVPLSWARLASTGLCVMSDEGEVARVSASDGEVEWCRRVWPAGGDAGRGELHLLDGVLLASQESSVLLAPGRGEVLCRVDGLPGDVRRVVPIEGFELVTVGVSPDDAEVDELGLYTAGGFLGVVK